VAGLANCHHKDMKRLLSLLLGMLAFGQPAVAEPLEDIVAGQTASTAGLSAVVGVVADRDGILRAEAHGDAVIGVRAMTAATPMRVASISKLVVAIGVWRLAEQGVLDLDADVSGLLGWRLRHPGFGDVPVTLRMLLSHTSGIVDGPAYSFPLEVTLEDSMTAAHWGPGAPGARFEYANLNYGVIASVMEAATGERFDALMTRLVLAPLGLDAGYQWQGASDAAVAAAAVLYRRGVVPGEWQAGADWLAQVDDLKGLRPAGAVRSSGGCDLAAYELGTNGTLFGPQGGLRISALGLARIGRMLLRGGEVDGVRLLRPETVAAMKAPVWRAGSGVPGDTYKGQMLCYGAGPQCLSGRDAASDQPVKDAAWWGHLGEAYGLLAGLWVDDLRGRVIVYALTGSAEDPFSIVHQGSSFSAVEDMILAELNATGEDMEP
jgi:CubicO group peptidase (beta-lactamase class C family)